MVSVSKSVVVLSVFATSLLGCAAPHGSGHASKMQIRPQPKTRIPSQPTDGGVAPAPTTGFERCVARLDKNYSACYAVFNKRLHGGDACRKGANLRFTMCLERF